MGGGEHLVRINPDAVAVVHLAMPVALHQFIVILVIEAAPEILLDTTSAGRVITRCRQADGTAVGQDELLLHQRLAIGAASHDQTAVVVLQGSGENLAGAGAELIDEHCDLYILVLACAIAPGLVVVALVAAVNADDQLVGGQELVGHAQGHLHKSAAVSAQVDHITLGALIAEARHGSHELLISIASELIDLDIARVLVQHIVGSDCILRDGTARDSECESLAAHVALDT